MGSWEERRGEQNSNEAVRNGGAPLEPYAPLLEPESRRGGGAAVLRDAMLYSADPRTVRYENTWSFSSRFTRCVSVMKPNFIQCILAAREISVRTVLLHNIQLLKFEFSAASLGHQASTHGGKMQLLMAQPPGARQSQGSTDLAAHLPG